MGSSKSTEHDVNNSYRHDSVGKEEDAMDDHADHESRAAPVEPVFGAFRRAANSMSHLKKGERFDNRGGAVLSCDPTNLGR